MINEIPQPEMPVWLASLDAKSIDESSFPLMDILGDSLYYPASGFDGDPVKYFAGNVFSFIFVDYSKSEENLFKELKTAGFKGYQIVGSREVSKQELTPHGWTPSMPLVSDSDPARYHDWMAKPFAFWAIFQREADFLEDHGPERFSLLYLCADGVAAFQALYISNNQIPKIVAVIQPGHGFGGNWTNFEDPNKIFARSVLRNAAGTPEYLLYGGKGNRDFYQKSCWPDSYNDFICFLDKGGGGIGVWRKNA